MQKIFKLNSSGDNLIVEINSNKKVNITLGNEEINFFLGNPQFNNAEMSYLYNFLEHELASSMAFKIYNEIAAIVGRPNKQEPTSPSASSISAAPKVIAASTNLFGDAVGTARTKRPYSKRTYNYKLFSVRIDDKNDVCVFERTNNFRTKKEGVEYAEGIIKEIGMGSKSKIYVTKV